MGPSEESKQMDALKDRVVVITGAGRGIGREHALLLASEGAAVVVNDLGTGGDGVGASADPAQAVVAEIRGAGGQAVANTADVTTADGADSLVHSAVSTFGRLDGLVNNAGILRDSVLVNMSDEDWDLSLRVNLRGHFMPLRAAGRYWREQTKAGKPVSAAIVNTSSESGVFANAGQANYAAAKSAVATLTEVAGKELVRYGVRTNAILPRARTRLTETLVPPPPASGFDRWAPANVSPFVAHLLRSACQINGQVFLVGGGIVQRLMPWSLDTNWLLRSDGRWEQDEIESAIASVGLPTNDGRLTGNIR